MAEPTGLDSKKYQWMFNIAGIYLGICIMMHFVYPPEQQYNDSIKKCGRASPFCDCQAKASVDQRNFFTNPLIIVGLKTFQNVAAQCSHLLNR